jgi:hypothetical protein
MNERVQIAAKKPEIESENLASSELLETRQFRG